MNTKVLITGAAGFIGSNLVEYLLEKNTDIVTFDRIQELNKPPIGRVTSVVGSLYSPVDVEGVFKKHGPFRAVYNLGAVMPDKYAKDEILWKTSRELIHLVDQDGKVIDAITY